MLRSLLLLMVLIVCLPLHSVASEELSTTSAKKETSITYSIEEIPMIVIGYNLFCERYGFFKSLESNSHNPLIRLDKNVEKLSAGVQRGLAFTHMVFTVQNDIIGQQSGFLRVNNKTLEESGVPFKNILFVTTPIKSFGNRVLAILSAVSPEYTTIFAVDNELNVELLYDDMKKRDITNLRGMRVPISMGSIYGIRVVKPGYLLLQERMVPGGYGFAQFLSPYENRSFIVDITNGDFRMELERRK